MSLATIGFIGLIGTAGMIQDPSRVRLLGPCSKLESTAIKFDEQGRLIIDLSSLPPLTADRRKAVCQIKVPYHEGSRVMAGSWQMDAQYHAAHGSKMLSTVRFSAAGTVGPAQLWSIEQPSTEPLSWKESYSILDEEPGEAELKITWTSELQMPSQETAPQSGCGPSFQWKQIIVTPTAATSDSPQ
ncbi:hypothetical protein [Oligoflexus tunisiensis]|uniref:hypothetical protein n=1 Tax=Oligoflexus tunisiensis TaxID=708132 RepID=UPI00114CBFC7|nr:hypothetical protein [Oligoflexus tunisiensis]